MLKFDIIFPCVCQAMTEAVDLPAGQEHSTLSFVYDENGYTFEGHGSVSGQWSYCGDGYDEPYSANLHAGCGSIDTLHVEHYDDDTDILTAFDCAEVEAFRRRLEAALNDFMLHDFN